MEIKILPHEGLEARLLKVRLFTVTFGMDRAAVQKAVGSSPEIGRRGEGDTEYQFYVSLGMFVYFDGSGMAEAAEFGGGLAPTLTYEGYSLFRHTSREVLAWARRLDPDLQRDSCGFQSRRLGLAMYAPAIDEEEQSPAEGIMAFAPSCP